MNNIEIHQDALFIVIERPTLPDFPPIKEYIKVLDKETFQKLLKEWSYNNDTTSGPNENSKNV